MPRRSQNIGREHLALHHMAKNYMQSPKKISLALQGGGAQGAFTWGVLDRLLEDDSIEIEAISGTSAGALNGAALVSGMAKGGRAGAKQNLNLLWTQVAQAGSLLTFLTLPLRKPGMGVWDDALPIVPPLQANPAGMTPLRRILNTVMDVDCIRKSKGIPRLFVNALHVQSGQERIFGPRDLTIEAVLASACVPESYQAIQIDGDSYWDGSYASNPPLSPLYEGNINLDILLVELNPIYRKETPYSAKNILNRINEVASVRGLIGELKLLKSVNETVPEADIRMHLLSLPDREIGPVFSEPSIKRTVGFVLFQMLKQEGRLACQEWLEKIRL